MSFFTCITGIDGSGKTTISRKLTAQLNEANIDSIYVYDRYIPFLLRPFICLSKYTLLRKENFNKDYLNYSNSKKSFTNKHKHLSSIYITLLTIDYFLQTFLKIKIPLILGKNIVCDRYLYDTIITDISVDFNYSNKDILSYLNRIQFLFPIPDIIFLIDIPEELAYERKNDIPSLEYLKDRRNAYAYLGNELNMIVLDGTESVEALLWNMEKAIVQRAKKSA